MSIRSLARDRARDYVHQQRKKALDELVRLTEETGGYPELQQCGKPILGVTCVLQPGHDRDCHEGAHKRGHGPECAGCFGPSSRTS